MRLSLLIRWPVWLPTRRFLAWGLPGRHRATGAAPPTPPPAPGPVVAPEPPAPAAAAPMPSPSSVRSYARRRIPDHSAFRDVALRHEARWALAYEPDQPACYVARSLVEDGIVVAASSTDLLDAALTEFTPAPRIRPYAVDPQAATMARQSEQRLLARMIREAAAA